MPPSSRGFFRPREKSLILLVLVTFGFFCFGTIFFLPDRAETDNAAGDNRVYRVYKGLRDAGHEFMLPPPPAGAAGGGEPRRHEPVRHNVLDRPDPHRAEDKARLMAQVEMDLEMSERNAAARARPPDRRVLPKPNGHEGGRANSTTTTTTVKELLPVKGGGSSPKGAVVTQEGADKDPAAAAKRDVVAQMMRHAWDGYARYGWGRNEVRPMSKRGHSASIFGSASMGATIVDALDTLYIMGFMEEFNAGREWVDENLDMNKMLGDISVFETNIRYVGGLLSCYAFTGDEMFKAKAVHVADKLLPAFDTPTGIPYALVNMRTTSAKNFGWASGGASILSEFGTLHMEFAYLSDVTGNPVYAQKVEQIRKVILSAERPKSLYPNYLSPKTGKWGQSHTSMGALGDSFYEYLLKEWLRSGKRDLTSKRMFDEAALDVEKHLVKVSPGGLTYFAEYKYGRLEHKMDHLACFGGGMYGLAAHEERDANSERWMGIAAGITNTCHESYARTDTRLGPEAFRFTDSVEARAVKSSERYYILRPETVESYFIMWRLTHDQKYRDWGWDVVQALEKHCKAEGGYQGVKNVYSVSSPKDDVQQSFFLAETLKYLYLLFSDDSLISLDQWVFNTEAHPLPIKGANSMYRAAAANSNNNSSNNNNNV